MAVRHQTAQHIDEEVDGTAMTCVLNLRTVLQLVNPVSHLCEVRRAAKLRATQDNDAFGNGALA